MIITMYLKPLDSEEISKPTILVAYDIYKQ